MPTLQVRELPEDVYRGLVQRAEAEQRSISQEAIVLLRKGMGDALQPRIRRQAILDSLPHITVHTSDSMADPETLIREDRDR